jgi:hypothetical protein
MKKYGHLDKIILGIVVGFWGLFVAYPPIQAHAAIVLVSTTTIAEQSGSQTTVSSSLSNISINNLVVCGFRAGSSGNFPTKAADTGSSTWAVVATDTTTGSNAIAEWYAVVSSTTTPIVITATWSGAVSNRDIECAQYSGTATTNVLDVHSGNTSGGSTGTQATSTAVTTTGSDVLVVVGSFNAAKVATANPNYTMEDTLSTADSWLQDRISNSILTSEVASSSWSGGTNTWNELMGAFKAASSNVSASNATSQTMTSLGAGIIQVAANSTLQVAQGSNLFVL